MFVEITRGRSFKGLAQYCLHDAGKKTSERVDFVETRNLATSNPNVAWRVMAARHYMQDELKAKAGVGLGGRKNGKPVGHLVLGWRRDEAEAQGLDRGQMVSAATEALRSIGADEHQALIVAHSDTEHPHCHVIVNLIGDDGRLKKNWKEREKLSKFALEHEIAHHGEPIVRRRSRHWEDRQAGETPEPVKKKSRNLFELDRAVERHPQLSPFAQEHRQKLAEFEKKRAAQEERHRRPRDRLKEVHDERIRRIRKSTDQAIRQHKTEVRKAHKSFWAELHKRQAADRRQFQKNEQALRGSIANAWRLIDWKAALGSDGRPRRGALKNIFNLLTSEVTRRTALEQEQATEKTYLRAKQRKLEQEKADRLRADETRQIKAARQSYTQKAAAMKARQAKQAETFKRERRELVNERQSALARVGYDRVEHRWHEQLTESKERKSRRRRTGGEKPPREKRPRRPKAKEVPAEEIRPDVKETPIDLGHKLQDDFEARMRDDLLQRRKDRSHDRER
ncbi:relaxase/mobilization nuclease domain-containing protein [Stratiformator vulcanicus]|uniref:Relaxase/Mobilization nuclease domain protein n=1 Tax=Stratiformator vulcanicus TaxID=2527980 RepID=A0A517R1C5_9PLAN|nr:relaxase/mobilization nuclease domain-containing protein [Stratiformator vulcanicus]QDT37681.1 Relaxase/Mobilization nuclease domain protein [Stratiformator vulcanicus]